MPQKITNDWWLIEMNILIGSLITLATTVLSVLKINFSSLDFSWKQATHVSQVVYELASSSEQCRSTLMWYGMHYFWATFVMVNCHKYATHTLKLWLPLEHFYGNNRNTVTRITCHQNNSRINLTITSTKKN